MSAEWTGTVAAGLLAAATLAAWAVCVYLVAAAASLSLGCARTVAHMRAPRRDRSAGGGVRLVLLLPMLREERVVAPALRQFLPVVRSGRSLDVVVVTTARETREREQALAAIEGAVEAGQWSNELEPALAKALEPEDARALLSLARRAPLGRDAALALLRDRAREGTHRVAATVAAELNAEAGREAFVVVEAPAEAAGKVGQLNTGLSWWCAQGGGADPNDVYVGVYDADSTPDPAVFEAIERIVARRDGAERPRPAIFQQISCYCQNLPELSGPGGTLSRADALAQTRWALGFEFPLYQGYSRSVQRDALRRLVYCVGHGCFVSLAMLQDFGGFPTCSPNDDLALGYLASLSGREVLPLPVLDFCDVVPDPLASVRQSRFWFLGSSRFREDLAYFEKRFGLRPGLWQRLFLVLDGGTRNLFWAWRGAMWLAALAFAVATRSWVLVAALVAAHVLYVHVGVIQTLQALRRIPGAAERARLSALGPSDVAGVLLVATATFILRGVGPMLGALGRKPGQAWKVER